MTVTLYPNGYATSLVTLDRMRQLHQPRMHPVYAVNLFAFIESAGGLLGIGGGYRPLGEQPDKPGFAPEGMSFHQPQTFRSGIVGYCATDLVARNGLKAHRSPTFVEVALAPQFALHHFIASEPWHNQPINIRGHASWVAAGRPDPLALTPPKPEVPHVQYFIIGDVMPATLWVTDDESNATRITAGQYAEQPVPDHRIERRSRESLTAMRFHGLPIESVR